MVLYYGLVTAISLAAAVQISRQVFFAQAGSATFATCQEGQRALAAAVERARRAAPGEGGEDAALGRFRGALEPEWSSRDAIMLSCRGRAEDERALDAIERLRYAEEHAARREAGDLAPLRRRVQTIVENELGPGPSRSAEPPSAGDRR